MKLDQTRFVVVLEMLALSRHQSTGRGRLHARRSGNGACSSLF